VHATDRGEIRYAVKRAKEKYYKPHPPLFFESLQQKPTERGPRDWVKGLRRGGDQKSFCACVNSVRQGNDVNHEAAKSQRERERERRSRGTVLYA
jgi:hypothetical protein